MRVSLHAAASKTIGWGHYFRLCSLGEELVHRGHEVLFALASEDKGLAERLRRSGISVVDPDTMRGFSPTDFVIVDDYEPPAELLEVLRVGGAQLVQIVDAGVTRRIPGALVVRPDPLNLADGELSGIEFAMIGADIRRQMEVRAVRVDGVISVVIGGGGNEIEEKIARHLEFSLGIQVTRPRVVSDLTDRSEFLHQVAGSSVCVVGAGTSLWECAALGIPAVSLVVAKNQRAQAEWAQDNGLCIAADKDDLNSVTSGVQKLLESTSLREGMSRRGREVVDGRGVCRIADWLQTRYEQHA